MPTAIGRDRIRLLVVQFFFAAFSLQSILMSTPMFQTPRSPNHLISAICIVNAVVFAAAFFGIYLRASFGWKLGLIAFMLFFVDWMSYCLATFLKAPTSGSGTILIFFLAFGLCIAVFTTRWWLRLKACFPGEKRV